MVVAHLLLWTRGPADTFNPVSHQPFLAPPACPPCEFARIPSLTGVSWDEGADFSRNALRVAQPRENPPRPVPSAQSHPGSLKS